MKKFIKNMVASISALVMCVSVMPLSASAEINPTSIQQVSNEDVYNQVLALGFDEDEAQYIVDHVDADEILSILGTGSSSVSRSTTTSTYSLDHATYSNVSSWNTDGSCASVASAIFLIYYSCYHYPEITYSSPYNLYLALKPYIETNANTRSSTLSSIRYGLRDYLNEHDNSNIADDIRVLLYNDSSATTTVNFKKMCLLTIAHLNGDEPVIANGIYSSTSVSGHVVVIEGIEIVQDSSGNVDTNNTYIYVNDGWGNTHQKLNFKNFVTNGQILYLF